MAQAIPIVLAVAGTLLQAGGTIFSANAKAHELRTEAAQLEEQAGLERASSQRQSIEQRRQATLASSRALALAAASGGGADDPSVLNAIAGIDGEGEYRAMSAIYSGDQSALGKEAQAAANRRGAKTVRTAGLLEAGSTILSRGASLFDKYGEKPPEVETSTGAKKWGRGKVLPARVPTSTMRA